MWGDEYAFNVAVFRRQFSAFLSEFRMKCTGYSSKYLGKYRNSKLMSRLWLQTHQKLNRPLLVAILWALEYFCKEFASVDACSLSAFSLISYILCFITFFALVCAVACKICVTRIENKHNTLGDAWRLVHITYECTRLLPRKRLRYIREFELRTDFDSRRRRRRRHRCDTVFQTDILAVNKIYSWLRALR